MKLIRLKITAVLINNQKFLVFCFLPPSVRFLLIETEAPKGSSHKPPTKPNSKKNKINLKGKDLAKLRYHENVPFQAVITAACSPVTMEKPFKTARQTDGNVWTLRKSMVYFLL